MVKKRKESPHCVLGTKSGNGEHRWVWIEHSKERNIKEKRKENKREREKEKVKCGTQKKRNEMKRNAMAQQKCFPWEKRNIIKIGGGE